MALPLLITGTIGAVTSYAGKAILGAAVAGGVVAGILRVITLLGIGVVTYKGLDVLGPQLNGMLNTAGAVGSGQGTNLIGPLFAILNIQVAVSTLISAFLTRALYSTALRFGKLPGTPNA